MLVDVRRVWVIQTKSTGQFLHLDLYLVRGLKHAGRAPNFEVAEVTAIDNLGTDYEIFSFYELEEDDNHEVG